MFRRPLINLAEGIFKGLIVSKIRDSGIRQIVDRLSTGLFQVGDALTDKEPDNDEQLKAIWKANRGFILKAGIAEIKEEIEEEINNPHVATSLNNFLSELEEKIAEKYGNGKTEVS